MNIHVILVCKKFIKSLFRTLFIKTWLDIHILLKYVKMYIVISTRQYYKYPHFGHQSNFPCFHVKWHNSCKLAHKLLGK